MSDRFISRDPRNYKDPFVFNPSRFLGSEPELDPNEYVFGFGRRVCSGEAIVQVPSGHVD
jgi:cytochrome P450